MPDILDTLAIDTNRTIKEGYYEISCRKKHHQLSLSKAVMSNKNASIISEIKFRSPSTGLFRKDIDHLKISREMEDGGAVAVSVITEPKHFKGNIKYLMEIRNQVRIPILMKDIILKSLQIDLASRIGVDVILLIHALFDRGYCEKTVKEMIEETHSKGLEVLLEVHTQNEWLSAIETDADMIGINNRDLRTFEVNLETTKHLLKLCEKGERIVVSESGIHEPEDIRMLHQWGANAFLVGTSIMRSTNIRRKVQELVESL